MDKNQEVVLCLSPQTDDIRKALATKEFFANRLWLTRGVCESRPEYKQLIPYVVIYDIPADCYLVYQRKSGDSRLLGNYSLGLGGHINREDAANGLEPSTNTIVQNNINRELQEELKGRIESSLRWWDYFRGYIYDDSNHVGSVHLGMIFLRPFVLHEEKFTFEDDEHKFGLKSASEIVEEYDKFETWSQVVIDGVIRKKPNTKFISPRGLF